MRSHGIFIRLAKTVLACIGIATLISCGGGEGDENQSVDTARTSFVKSNAQKVFYAVPSPIEMAALLQRAGAKYDSKILNDINNTSRYISNATKAINLGIYGADLTYSSICDQTQETMFFLKAAKNLADGLGISEAFKKEIIERMENNINNKDSMMAIISESFTETDTYLQENDRANVSALVIAGGWIEGLHIACKVAKTAPKAQEIRTRIAEQKFSLDNLLEILSAYPEDPAVSDLAKDLRELKEVFAQIDIKTGNATVSNNPDGSVTIGSDVQAPTLTTEQLNKISNKIEEIRSKLIN